MVTRAEWYGRVNDAWPKDLPDLTSEEATRAARRLYRYAMGRTFEGKVIAVNGRRRVRLGNGRMSVNPAHGWSRLVHDLSHWFFYYANPVGTRPHDRDHAKLELRMIKQVIARGWLDGKLRKPQKVKPTPIEQRFARILVRIKAWERKARRAKNALAKLHKQARYYHKRLGDQEGA